MDFKPGDVLSVGWDERPIRVLMADYVETFYEALIPDIGWSLTPARTAVYYRTSTAFLRKTSERVGKEPLTAKELAKHRPDLPMRLFQSTEANWNKPLAEWPRFPCEPAINAPRLAIIPFGPKGAPLRPVPLEAVNGRSFAADELFGSAHRLQIADCPNAEGVGLFRSGVSGGLPSYYLWGAIDKAGHAG